MSGRKKPPEEIFSRRFSDDRRLLGTKHRNGCRQLICGISAATVGSPHRHGTTASGGSDAHGNVPDPHPVNVGIIETGREHFGAEFIEDFHLDSTGIGDDSQRCLLYTSGRV